MQLAGTWRTHRDTTPSEEAHESLRRTSSRSAGFEVREAHRDPRRFRSANYATNRRWECTTTRPMPPECHQDCNHSCRVVRIMFPAALRAIAGHRMKNPGALLQAHESGRMRSTSEVAYHALRADLREKAVTYLRQAGRKAAARSANVEARPGSSQALSTLEALPEHPAALEQAFDVRLELRQVLNVLGEGREMSQRTREADALAERLNDDGRRSRVWAFLTTVHSQRASQPAARISCCPATDARHWAVTGSPRRRAVTATAESSGREPWRS